jgi:hypothetical protein
MKKETKKIYIQWEGPFIYDLENKSGVKQITNCSGVSDYGLYQIYGSHPIYGLNSLLYIGRTVAADMTFSRRVIAKKWSYWKDKFIYLGRFSNTESMDEVDWTNQIKFAEALFINYLTPAWNISGVNNNNDLNIFDQFRECRVINYGNRMALPEVMVKGDWSCQTQIEEWDRSLIFAGKLKLYEWIP